MGNYNTTEDIADLHNIFWTNRPQTIAIDPTMARLFLLAAVMTSALMFEFSEAGNCYQKCAMQGLQCMSTSDGNSETCNGALAACKTDCDEKRDCTIGCFQGGLDCRQNGGTADECRPAMQECVQGCCGSDAEQRQCVRECQQTAVMCVGTSDASAEFCSKNLQTCAEAFLIDRNLSTN